MTNVNEGIAERLRRGQANLDRMKMEIQQTVSQVLGAVEWDFGIARTIESDEFLWTLSWMPRGCCIECVRIARDGAFVRNTRIYVHSPGNPHQMYRENVRLVHRALDVLVSGVMLSMPTAVQAFRSILDYAD